VENYAKLMGIKFPEITLDRTIEILNNVIEQKRSELFHVITLIQKSQWLVKRTVYYVQ
jgi:N-acetylglucosaminyldiphosphoundecaprenol N-acetyl-beta-D-mannosaminyltransferase